MESPEGVRDGITETAKTGTKAETTDTAKEVPIDLRTSARPGVANPNTVALADSVSGIKAQLKETKYAVNDNGKMPKITLRSLQADWNVYIGFCLTLHSFILKPY